jgi:hypothetical protein
MGAVFAFGAASNHMGTASPEALVGGMRLTFAIAAGLVTLALAIAVGRPQTRA